MSDVQNKVSYLQGLAKGLDFDAQSVEGKMLLNMVEVLDSVAKELKDMQLLQQDLEDYVDTMDEDLEHLETVVYEDSDIGDMHLECPHCHAEVVLETEEANFMEVACPACGCMIYVREQLHADCDAAADRYSRRSHPGI
ncbi:MAG: AraC family transcriptional regulator [Sporomusaceae bacterium]|nr:AraC family transcriptional regulator [Sporomusaceae bacterium]